MAPSLLRIAALLLLCQLAPSSASAQYLFADTNGDSICDPYDHFENGLDTVWIWIDTNHDLFGGVVTCPTGEDLTISDYELCLDVSSYATGYQPVTVGKWINKVPEFTDSLGFHVGTNGPTRVHVYYSSSGASNHLPPGKRLLGGLEVTMAPRACNRVYFAPEALIGGISYETSFYSKCPGTVGDNRVRLGTDFLEACQAGDFCSGIESTTWGQMKQRYR